MRHRGDVDFDQGIVRQIGVDVDVERGVDEVGGVRATVAVDQEIGRVAPGEADELRRAEIALLVARELHDPAGVAPFGRLRRRLEESSRASDSTPPGTCGHPLGRVRDAAADWRRHAVERGRKAVALIAIVAGEALVATVAVQRDGHVAPSRSARRSTSGSPTSRRTARRSAGRATAASPAASGRTTNS